MDASTVESYKKQFGCLIGSESDQLRIIEEEKNIFELRSATKQDIFEIKIEIKEMELRLYSFIFKVIGSSVSVLVGLQALFHFLG